MAALLAVCLPVALQARVFRRWGGGARGGGAAGISGKTVYQAALLSNGQKVDVSVVACDNEMDGVRRSLRGQNAHGRSAFGDELGIGEMTRGGRSVRFAVLSPGGSAAPAVAIAVERPASERRAAVSEGRHEARGIPLYPGSRVTRSMLNQDTRTAFETVTAAAAPAEVMAFYESSLRRLGWERPFPAGADAGGIAFYARGADVCCVQTRRGDSDGETQVTLLHKQGALK
jgi:hypothetical protein